VRDSEWLPNLVQLSELAVQLDARDVLTGLYGYLEPYADRIVVEGIGAGVYGPVAFYLAAVARALGRTDDADRYADQATRRMAEAGVLVDPPRLCSPVDAPVDAVSTEAVSSTAEFSCEGSLWSLTFGGRTVRVKDSKGMRDLAVLVSTPGTPVHVVELAGAVAGATTAPDLDRAAIAAYRTRLADLEDDITEADANHDSERGARAREERDFLVAELTGAVGLGGRARRSGDATERARKAVAARLRDAIDRIGEVHPTLGRHFSAAVRTGTFCVYDPEVPLIWHRQEGSGA
jgi:hypothetical protein